MGHPARDIPHPAWDIPRPARHSVSHAAPTARGTVNLSTRAAPCPARCVDHLGTSCVPPGTQ
eukprot:227980-Chlamydomonas_euryale.AAC.4